MRPRARPRALTAAAIAGAVGQLLFYEELPGVNVALAVAIVLVLMAIAEPEWQPRRDDIWMIAAVVGLSIACAIRADPALVFLDVAIVVALLGALVASRAGVAIFELPLLRAARASFVTAVHVAWAAASLVREERARARAGGATAFGRFGPYIGGAALATPFLGIFAALFAGADAVFARWLDARIDDIYEVPERALLALLLGWAVAGALAFRSPRWDAVDRRPTVLGVDPVIAMLVLVDALFVVFVSLQVTYLFGGRDTLEAARMPYSEYARRGFFELIAVGGIVAVLIVALEVVMRRRSRLYVFLAIVLLAATAVILVSAAVRLDLYQQAYGWTEQRLYAAAAIAFLAAAMLALAWCLVRDRVLFIGRPLAIAAVLVALALSAVGPSSFIARANTDRVLDPSKLPADASRELDVRYLISLGDGAIPTLVERADVLPDRERTAVIGLLNGVAARFDLQRGHDWPSWDLDRERSRQALLTLGPGSRSGPANLH